MNNEVPSIKFHIDSRTARRIEQNRVILKSIIDAFFVNIKELLTEVTEMIEHVQKIILI